MPWIDVKPVPRGGGSKNYGARVTVACPKTRAGHTRLVVGFTGHVGAAVGIKKGDAVSVQMDALAGLLRIGRGDSFKVSGKNGTLGGHVNVPMRGLTFHAAETVEHRVEDGALIITLPPWAAPQRAGIAAAADAAAAARARAETPAPRKPFSIADRIPDPRASVQRPGRPA